MKIRPKKLIALITTMIFSVNFMCTSVYSAEETENSPSQSISTAPDVSVQGTDSFGAMVAAELSSAQDEQLENNGNNVFSVEMDGKTATVEYETLTDSTLVVGIYSEDGKKLLATGNTAVTAENKTAEVTIGISKMPDYFYIKAFLIDGITMRPLCTVYENPMYTQEMQEFLSKTTDDFEADRVYNLDEDKTNNFAVFNDEVIIIPETTEITHSTYTKENGEADNCWTVANPDETVSAVKSGDIITLVYGEKQYISRAASVEASEASISICTDSDLDIEDVFDYVKIDSTAGIDEENVDTSTLPEGATFEGFVEYADEEETSGSLDEENNSLSVEVTLKKSMKVSYDAYKFTENVTLTGDIEFMLEASVKYYLSIFHMNEAYVEVKNDYGVEANISITGKASKEIPLPKLSFRFYGAIEFAVTPKIAFEAEGSLSISVKYKGTVGVRVSSVTGVENLTSKPKLESEIKLEAKFFVGLVLEPAVNFISDDIVSLSFSAKAGIEIKGTTVLLPTDKNQNVKQDCGIGCIDGELYFKSSLSASAEFFKKLKFEKTILETKVKFIDFYYSLEKKDFGWGDCPYMCYKTQFLVYDNTQNPINYATVTVDRRRTPSEKRF